MTIFALLAMSMMSQTGGNLAAVAKAAPKEFVAAKRTLKASSEFGGGPVPLIAPFTTEWIPPSSATTAMAFPVIKPKAWSKGFNKHRGSYRHTGIDIAAPKLSPVIAPFSGILGFKVQTFWIYGDNGFFCLGTHLNDDTRGTNDGNGGHDMMFAANLRPGDHVRQGQLIGWVGNSGNATGPHLHFELFDAKGRIADPYGSLKTAYPYQRPLPVPIDARRPNAGEVRIDGAMRYFDPSRRMATVAAVTRFSRTQLQAYSQPTRYRLRIPKAVLDEVGVETLTNLPRDRAFAAYVKEDKNGKSGEVLRIEVLPE